MIQPLVSVLMPTYKQSAWIRRAVESLRAQTLTGWELLIVNDASPDDTQRMLAGYRSDRRIKVMRHPRNLGIGAALNTALQAARGRYIAYLPSDDLYYPDHLARLVATLESQPDAAAAYGGVRWNYETFAATLQGDDAVGREAELLRNPPPAQKGALLTNGNLFAMVQVLHRREGAPRWATRSEIVTDRLEPDYWRALLEQGGQFAYTGAVTCEWSVHPDQHHMIIAGTQGGLARYRQFYQISQDEPLNWQPSQGPRVDERERFAAYRQPRTLPGADGLRILLVGELGFNPERILALEERGHKLIGLWLNGPENWDSAGPLSYGNIEDIPFDRHWRDGVRAARPDVIYALLNWQAVPMIYEVFCANPGIPFVFHFKEGPFICQEKGTWSMLLRLLLESDARVLINDETFEWFQLATDGLLDPETTLILDGDPPKIDHFTEQWSPKRSALDGEVHTVCAGRLIGLPSAAAIARARIHFHFYGDHFHQMSPNFIREGLESGYLHLHPTVAPADWTRELSQYDAAWFHVFESRNGGDLRRVHWDDLNLPARLGGYAAAGLPWLLRSSPSARIALHRVARQHDFGVFFEDFDDLRVQLSDRPRLAELTANARQARAQFAFDTHADALVALLQKAIAARLVQRRVGLVGEGGAQKGEVRRASKG